LFTQFEEVEAREAFPCFDEPSFKIPYRVALDVPDGLVGLANTLPEKETVHGNWRRTEFRPTLALPSYLLAIAVGPFEFVEAPLGAHGTTIPIRIVTPKGQAALGRLAAEETPRLLAYLQKWFERPYAFDKLDLIGVPEFAFGAMENPGLIVFRDDILLADSAHDTASDRRDRLSVISHELAHLWFGDLVTMAWWDDLWLNESFADWLGDRTVDDLHPELDLGLQSLSGLAKTMAGDAQPTSEPIRLPEDARPEQAFQNLDIVYNKGHAVLDMIEGWLGRETFRRGVARYIEKYAFGNARGPDLWNMLSEVSQKDVTAVMRGFVDQPGLPLLTFERLGEAEVRVRQQRFATAGVTVPALTWKVPVLFRYADARGEQTHAVLLDGPEGRFSLPHQGEIPWIYPSADVRGYYHWSLPRAALVDLAAHATERLNVRERIGFLSNTAALLDAGAIDGASYVELLPPFAGDGEPAVLASLVERCGELGQQFLDDGVDGPADAQYAAFLRRLFGPKADALGWKSNPSESEAWQTLRPRLLGLLGDRGDHAPTRLAAQAAARSYLADPAALDPEVAGVALRLAARDGDAKLFDVLRARAEQATLPQDRDRYLSTLGRFRDPALADAALAYALSDAVRPTQIFTIVFGLSAQGEAGQERVYRWATDNYDQLSKKLPPWALGFLPGIAGGCSLDRLRRAEAFFGDPAHQVPGSARVLARTGSQVKACAALRQREGASVEKALKKSAG
jgi:alanyl aminopeptidase